jgi:oxygen-independent coproporphyrinogen-3 oxidase
MAFDEELSLLGPLETDGLVSINGRAITATEMGRKVVRVIAAVFDPHARGGAGRFSKAV